MTSPDLTETNIAKIAELFPAVVTETADDEGHIKKAIDFDLLRQELSGHVVDGPQERYQIDWPGKRAAAFAANAPIAKTLRPHPDESVDFDTTKNLIIEGDNLEVLKLLQEPYLGKVKLIYIDPPYNTGNDFVYEDDFAESSTTYLARSGQKSETGERLVTNTESNGRFHSDWLSMMYPRLKLAKNLLSDDGVLVVSIDENEHASLVRLGEEVLGEASYVGEIALKNSSKNDQAYISIQHEYIVFFVKNRHANSGEWIEKKPGLDKIYAAFSSFKRMHGSDWEAIHKEAKSWFNSFPASDPVSGSKHYNWMDERGIYFGSDISGPNDGQYVYDIQHPVTGQNVKIPSRGWVSPKESLEAKIANGYVHFGPDHTTVPKLKTYLADTEFQSLTSIRYVDGRAASKRLASLFGEKIFTNPKDEFLLRDIYRAVGVTGDDIVLDMFSGSGSALQAVLELNQEDEGAFCRFIGIQVAEDLTESHKTAKGAAKQIATNAIKHLSRLGRPTTVAEITKQRMRLVHDKMSDRAHVDSGFRVLKVDTSNMVDTFAVPDSVQQNMLEYAIDSVKSDRSAEDLLFQVLLSWALDLSEQIDTLHVEGQDIHVVAEGALIACFSERISEAVVREMATRRPLRAVFLDSGFSSDAARINAEQVFNEMSPETQVKAI